MLPTVAPKFETRRITARQDSGIALIPQHYIIRSGYVHMYRRLSSSTTWRSRRRRSRRRSNDNRHRRATRNWRGRRTNSTTSRTTRLHSRSLENLPGSIENDINQRAQCWEQILLLDLSIAELLDYTGFRHVGLVVSDNLVDCVSCGTNDRLDDVSEIVN